jgi:periplasmic protein TonB
MKYIKHWIINILLLNLVMGVFAVQAQQTDTLKDTSLSDPNLIYLTVEEMPEFPGGNERLFQFIQSNLQYPEYAKKNNIQGVVYVDFVVNNAGVVSDIKIRRGVQKTLDEEAIRVVSLLPKYKPGYQNGRPVSVQYTLPIRFVLGKTSPDQEGKN